MKELALPILLIVLLAFSIFLNYKEHTRDKEVKPDLYIFVDKQHLDSVLIYDKEFNESKIATTDFAKFVKQ